MAVVVLACLCPAAHPAGPTALARAEESCQALEKRFTERDGDPRTLLAGLLEECRRARDAVCTARVVVAVAELRGRAGGEAARRAAADCGKALPLLAKAGSRGGQATALRCIARAAPPGAASPLPAPNAVGPRRLLATVRPAGPPAVTPAQALDPAVLRRLADEAAAVGVAGDRRKEADAHVKLGRARTVAGDRLRAIESYDLAAAAARTSKDLKLEATALVALGTLQVEGGDRAAGRIALQRALPLYRATGNRTGEAIALGSLARAPASTRARIFLGKQAVASFDASRVELAGRGAAERREAARQAATVGRRLAEDLARQGRFGEAQRVLAQLREWEVGRLLPGRVPGTAVQPLPLSSREAAAKSRIDEALCRVASLQARSSELRGAPRRSAADDADLRLLDQQIVREERALDALLSSLDADFAPGAEERMKDEAALAKALAELGPGAVAVVTLVGERRLLTFLITPDEERGFETEVAAEEVTRRVRELRGALEDPGRGLAAVRAASQAVFELLVHEDLDLELRKATTVAWSLDGPLRYLPMAALWDGKEWLVERHRNVVVTPASESRLLLRPKEGWTVLGLGVTKAHAPLPALPAVGDELDMVVGEGAGAPGAFGGKKLLDEAFTKRALLAQLEERRPVLHVASHYLLRPEGEGEQGGESALLLGDGTQLSLDEIEQIPWRDFAALDLVVLSACETAAEGTDPALAGSEVDSFAEVAQRIGASAVVASLWAVSDASTAALMRQFYQRRKELPGETKADSLREAQLALLRGKVGPAAPDGARGAEVLGGGAGSGDWSHPFYWAPFVLIGNWR